MNKNITYILLSFLAACVVLWQLLASGYILTMDMIFGPNMNLVIDGSGFVNTLPTKYLLAFITYISNGWLAEKILLLAIFFLLFYLPLHFFKNIFGLRNTQGAEYVASLFFAVNPFVYERFLAGQWSVLFGYALLVPFGAYLIEFCKNCSYKNIFKILAIVILIGLVSTHILVISVIVAIFACLANLIGNKDGLIFIKRCLFLGLALLICSSYWIIPAILSNTTPLATFGPEHWEVFKTAGNGYLGTLGNVLTLHGFWGEHEKWISRFIIPSDGGWIFMTASMSFFALVFAGVCVGLKDRSLRNKVIFIISTMLLAIIFSCGIGEGIFRNINLWIFEHITFWSGFRDTEKWSALIVLGYAFFVGLGSMKILSYFKQPKYSRIVLYVLLAIPLFYTPMMLFGFAGQLKAVQYPNSWNEVNSVLKQEKNCRALFLPWHEYYSLKFNNDILTGNVSRSYFDCDIVRGQNMELDSIMSQGGNGEEYDIIEKLVIDNKANPDNTLELLKERGIMYVIFTGDIVGEDPYKYPFLGSKYSQKVINNGAIDLYRIF